MTRALFHIHEVLIDETFTSWFSAFWDEGRILFEDLKARRQLSFPGCVFSDYVFLDGDLALRSCKYRIIAGASGHRRLWCAVLKMFDPQNPPQTSFTLIHWLFNGKRKEEVQWLIISLYYTLYDSVIHAPCHIFSGKHTIMGQICAQRMTVKEVSELP